jgi:hypothetical protein
MYRNQDQSVRDNQIKFALAFLFIIALLVKWWWG